MKRNILFASLAFAILVFTQTFTLQAQPENWPLTTWVGYTYTSTAPIQDPTDIPDNQIEFDLIYDATNSPYTIQFAASTNMAFFRLQVRDITKWTVGTYLIFIANSSGTIIGKVYLTLTGNAGSINVANGTTTIETGQGSHNSNMNGWARFGGVPNSTYEYVDFQIPLSTIYTTLGITQSTQIKFYVGTNTGGGNINNINTDWMTPSTNGQPTSGDFSTLSWATVNDLRNGALPVELTSFTAHVKEGTTQLKWRTETELDNYGFEIQRSMKKDSWEVVGFVQGHGTSNSPRSYSYEDRLPNTASGQVSYRLRQIDRDGTEEYSPLVMVRLNATVFFGIADAFPNPFNPSTTLSLNLTEDAAVSVRLHDVTGRAVLTVLDNSALSAGSHSVMLNAADLPSGRYMAVMTTGTQHSVYPVLLSK